MINEFLPKNWKELPQNLKSYSHSKTVSRAALRIAENTKVLDPKKAEIYGLMHDIGKFYLPKFEMYKHPRVGYELLKVQHPDIANVCISHPFPDFSNFSQILHYCKNDKQEALQIFDILKNVEKTDYIELIQLCDKISRLDDYISIEGKIDWYLQNCKDIDPDDLNGGYVVQLKQLKKKFDILSNCDTYKLLDISC